MAVQACEVHFAEVSMKSRPVPSRSCTAGSWLQLGLLGLSATHTVLKSQAMTVTFMWAMRNMLLMSVDPATSLQSARTCAQSISHPVEPQPVSVWTLMHSGQQDCMAGVC